MLGYPSVGKRLSLALPSPNRGKQPETCKKVTLLTLVLCMSIGLEQGQIQQLGYSSNRAKSLDV